MSRSWIEDTDGVLIVGSPRSGTSLLTGMLAVHSEVAMGFEDFDFGCKGVIGKQVWGNKLTIPNEIRLDPDPRKSQRDIWTRLEDAVRAFLGRPRRFSPWGYGYDPPFYKPPRHRQITIDTYVEKFNVHLVALIRNPDHVIESMQKRRGTSLRKAKRRFAGATRNVHKSQERYDKVSIVRFKDLVEQPAGIMKLLCERFNINFERSMTEGFKAVPQYDFDKIDPSVATKQVPTYDFRCYDPEAYEMYKDLVDISL